MRDDELLARFVLYRRHRASNDGNMPPEAFLPYRHVELSVTRHIGLSTTMIWQAGAEIAGSRKLHLYGRGDVVANDARRVRLDVRPSEPPPNHANIVGWPSEKAAQMSHAIELAALAIYYPATSLPS